MLLKSGKVKETKTEMKFPHLMPSVKMLVAVCGVINESDYYKNYTKRCSPTHYKRVKTKIKKKKFNQTIGRQEKKA